MPKLFLASALAVAAFGIAQSTTLAANYEYNPEVVHDAMESCAMPVTKAYRIKQGFCPQALVYMIPGAVGPSCCCGGCGPYGIPPIYAAGQNVMVRQTPAMQERVKEFLTDLGALAEPVKRSY